LAWFFPRRRNARLVDRSRCRVGKESKRFRADASDPVTARSSLTTPSPQNASCAIFAISTSWAFAASRAPCKVGLGAFFPDFTLERGPDRVYVELIG
jgi:hypothetical protein